MSFVYVKLCYVVILYYDSFTIVFDVNARVGALRLTDLVQSVTFISLNVLSRYE